MAIARMATKNQHTVGANAECLKQKQRINPAATHHPNHPYIGSILNSGCAGQVSAGIRAPITAKGYDSWFKVIHLSS
jgi:hypothetical protein